MIRRSLHRVRAWLPAAVCAAALAAPACEPGGTLGAPCETTGDCADGLQCFGYVCRPRCERHPECGDGYQCDDSGTCVPATGAAGDFCTREVDCGAGLACQLAGSDPDGDELLAGTCVADHPGASLGAACAADSDCRNGTCALGRCVDTCVDLPDCPHGHACALIPRQAGGTLAGFYGCLPNHGMIEWSLPVVGPSDEVILPVPSLASSVAVMMTVSDPLQSVGMSRLNGPSGGVLYARPQTPLDYYKNPVRHRPSPRISLFHLPGGPAPLEPGPYRIQVSSFRPNGSVGTATPRVTAYVKLDDGNTLDLHFYFLDLADHPCAAYLEGDHLDAEQAQASEQFQRELVIGLRSILGNGGVALGAVTYDDLLDSHDLDGLESDDLDSLLSHAAHPGGLSVFFVRSLAPTGLAALVGRIPGAPGVPGTPASGIAVSVDSLCYRTWPQLARLIAHEIARFLGVPRTVEPDGGDDGLADTAAGKDNLLHYADTAGTALSEDQKRMLRRSPVLR